MKNITSINNTFVAITLLTFFSCVEEIDFVEANETFESALVIEATITNELKQQKIILSRTYAFEEDGPNPESGASVKIESDQGLINFTEDEPGVYLSESEFSAQQNVIYKLVISTSNGRVYTSTQEKLTQETEIENINAIRENNNFGVNGMAIYLNSFDPTNSSKYYRYAYEETYKIIAPEWKPETLLVTGNIYPDCTVELTEREQEEKTCYSTKASTNINLLSTISLTEDRVGNHLIRFIESDDFILTYRYSILVKQYVQTLESFSYYKALRDFSEGNGSLFSQTQPGFINGNIQSQTNTNEKVIGFFEVSSYSEKRLFFSYEDFYPNEPKPDFLIACIPYAPTIVTGGVSSPHCGELITGLERRDIVYFDVNEFPTEDYPGPYFVIKIPCGDCTALGSNIVPDFWEE